MSEPMSENDWEAAQGECEMGGMDFKRQVQVICEIDRLRAENADLRAKLATMVCGTCDDSKIVAVAVDDVETRFPPCPVCQPKGTPKQQPDYPRGGCGCQHAYIRVKKDSSSVCDDCGEEFPPVVLKSREPKGTP